MSFAASRLVTVVVATASLLAAGLISPAASAPAPETPATVVRTLRGLPAAVGARHVSKQVAAPIPFSMVGFEVPPGASLEFRTSVDGNAWSPWEEAEVAEEEGPDPGSVEGRNATPRMTMPIWVGEAAAVQTRLEGGAEAVPGNVGVHLVDSSGLGRWWGERVADRLRGAWRGTPPAAQAAVGKPAIVTRSQWGANEALRRGSPSYASGIKAGFVHHTVNSNNYTRAQADDLVRGIYSYHTQSNGWSDMGYNFLVDRFGTIYEGRYGGVTKPVIGAHAGGFNTATFGVSLIGSFDGVTPPAAMLAGLRSLLAWKYDVHHTSVLGKTSYTSYGSTRYSTGTTVSIQRLSGHRDASTTACPGSRTYDLLPTLRRQVAELQGPVILYPQASPTAVEVVDGRSVSGPVTFNARLRPAGAWGLKLTTPAGDVVPLATGSGTQASYEWHPEGMAPGVYRYTFTSPDRRAAHGWLSLQSPHIEGAASPGRTTFAPDGTLSPVTFSGTLYEGADWRLRIFDPAGVRVKRFRGTGASFTKTWDTPVSQPGIYRWDLAADGGTPVTGAVRLEADFVDRLGVESGTAAAAAAIARRTFPEPGSAQHAVLSPLGEPGHALVAGPLAGTSGPVLYAGASRIRAETVTELQRVLPAGRTVYVVGDAISDAALARIDVRRNGHWQIHRIAGSSAPQVAAAAAPLVLARSSATSGVLAGNSGDVAWRQNVAAGAYAARHGLPILLTKRSRLSPAAARALKTPVIVSVTVVGNTDAVAPQVVEKVRETKIVKRVSGPTSAGTAKAVARRAWARTTAATGDRWLFANTSHRLGWARAFAAVPLAAATNAPLLVSGSTGVPAVTAGYLDGLGYDAATLGSGTVLGDAQHINSTAETTLARRLQ